MNIEKIVWRLYSNCDPWIRFLTLARCLLCPFEELVSFVPKEGKIADLGCGTGIFANLLSLECNKRSIIGLDANSYVIEAARKTVSNRKNIKFLVRRVNEVQLDGDYDVITIIDLLHHIPFEIQERVLIMSYEKIVSGGILLLKEIDKTPKWRYIANIIHDSIKDFGNKLYVRDHREYCNLLQEIGFSVKVIYMPKAYLPHVLYYCKKCRGGRHV